MKIPTYHTTWTEIHPFLESGLDIFLHKDLECFSRGQHACTSTNSRPDTRPFFFFLQVDKLNLYNSVRTAALWKTLETGTAIASHPSRQQQWAHSGKKAIKDLAGGATSPQATHLRNLLSNLSGEIYTNIIQRIRNRDKADPRYPTPRKSLIGITSLDSDMDDREVNQKDTGNDGQCHIHWSLYTFAVQFLY